MLIAIGVYSFAWIVSLFVVVVHTKRESVALKRDIALLKERQKHHLSNPLVQQPLNKYPPNHIQPQMSSSPLTPTSNPATANKNINPALRISVTPAASPRFTPLQAADSTDDEKFPSSENKEDEDDPWGSALVVPSTPETNNLILALAAGDDLDRAIFDDFDASGLPPSLDPVALAIHEHDEETSQSRSASVLRRFSSLKQHQHHHQSTIPSAFTSNHKHNKLLNRTGSLSSIATSSIHGASSKYLSPDLNQAGSGINGKGLNLPVLSGNGRSVSSVAESVIFVPSQTQR
ncbi:hypothetical protein BC830DRAFT_778045 [Chytriomyces sp. MP71]|nr:hypothetical protein BC830DRAFT_778045 [Chytriomyces sp. MP71]